MKKVVALTVGPRGAGKSTFCKRVLRQNFGEVGYVSRDEIFERNFGTIYLRSYDYSCAIGFLLERVREIISSHQFPRIILDCWNDTNRDREYLSRFCKESGTSQFILWDFVTDYDHVCRWYASKWKKESGRKRITSDLPRYIYEQGIKEWQKKREKENLLDCKGIDAIVQIDPVAMEDTSMILPFLFPQTET